MDETTIARFWARVDKSGPAHRNYPELGACWLWRGSVRTDGYGQMSVNGRLMSTHRISWIHHHGAISRAEHVLHRCDVRLCVNPEHLFLGNPTVNMRDAREKGRLVLAPGGVLHNRSKLNPDKVREIRRLHATGRYGYKPLARMFGVYDRAIIMIVKRLSWKRVE